MSTYIHQNPQWPHFVWDKVLVAEKLAIVNKASGFLLGRLDAIAFDTRLSANAETLSNDIISSSEIEGISLNVNQVRSSIAKKLGIKSDVDEPSNHYVEGVVEMILDAVNNYRQPLTDDRLFGWHNCLFPSGMSGFSKIDVAQYRKGEMKVVSGSFGREKVHYEAVAAMDVPKEMNAFLDWFNSDVLSPTYLKSAIAHFWFVCIHPFDDGNGRIGRAIADMALSQADDSALRFFSMSRQINTDKKSYYEVLERVSRQSDIDITEWLIWYLDCMLRAIHASDELLSRVLQKASFWQHHSGVAFSERQNKMLNFYLDGYQAKLTVKNWARFCKVSVDTASRDIKSLVENGVLEAQQGRVRDVSYGIRCDEATLFVPKPREEDFELPNN